VTVARLFGVTPETINRRIRDIRQLLGMAGHIIHPADHQLTTLDHLYDHANAVGITVPPKIKTAS
ncbi:ISAzo13 family transposase, partial [Streptomyces sp. 2MCAF27]